MRKRERVTEEGTLNWPHRHTHTQIQIQRACTTFAFQNRKLQRNEKNQPDNGACCNFCILFRFETILSSKRVRTCCRHARTQTCRMSLHLPHSFSMLQIHSWVSTLNSNWPPRLGIMRCVAVFCVFLLLSPSVSLARLWPNAANRAKANQQIPKTQCVDGEWSVGCKLCVDCVCGCGRRRKQQQ